MVERYTKSMRFEDSLTVLTRPDVFPLLLIADCTENQQLKVYAPHVAQRCSESVRVRYYILGFQIDKRGWVSGKRYPALLLFIIHYRKKEHL